MKPNSTREGDIEGGGKGSTSVRECVCVCVFFFFSKVGSGEAIHASTREKRERRGKKTRLCFRENISTRSVLTARESGVLDISISINGAQGRRWSLQAALLEYFGHVAHDASNCCIGKRRTRSHLYTRVVCTCLVVAFFKK